MSADPCPYDEDVAGFVAGELSPSEEAVFEQHLDRCVHCREAVVSARNIFGLLRVPAPVKTGRDLAPAVLARIREEEARTVLSVARWPRIAALAAGIAVCAGATFFALREARSPVPTAPALASDFHATETSVTRALDWFCQTQELDGSWDAAKWGGNPRFAVALTALPALALGAAEHPTPAQNAAAERAVTWLRQQQNTAGCFGPDFQAAPYNHSIATLALLRAYQRRPDPELKAALDSALAAIVARQTASGGWGYLYSPIADHSITEWNTEALDLAIALGWNEMHGALDHAREWLAAHVERQGEGEEPADSPSRTLAMPSALGAPVDFYRTYFLTAALRTARDGASLQRLAAIRETLQRHQTLSGPASGSWPADDQWGRAGGRLYSTALASLSLREL